MMRKIETTSRIVYVLEDINTPQFRYRVENIIEAFENNGKWSVEYYLKSDLEKLELKNVKLFIVGGP